MNTWLIPDGFVPSVPEEKTPELFGHEALCIVNTNNKDITITVDVYFLDRDPLRDISFTIPAERSTRIYLGDKDVYGNALNIKVPSNTPYSLRISSENELALQFTRVDTRSENLALMSVVVPQHK